MLLFFRFIILLIFFVFTISFIFFFSEVKIILDTVEYDTIVSEKKIKYTVKIGIYFLGKIKILSKKINDKKTENFLNNKFIKETITRFNILEKDNTTAKYRISIKYINELKEKIKIESFKLQLIIDTENVLLTSYLVGIISAVIPYLIRNNIDVYDNRKYKWNIIPIYKNKNYISLKLNSIISIKVVHIINMLKMIGGIKNERSSNRRFNANCYGEH